MRDVDATLSVMVTHLCLTKKRALIQPLSRRKMMAKANKMRRTAKAIKKTAQGGGDSSHTRPIEYTRSRVAAASP